MAKRKTTDQQETEIRRRIFKLHHEPKKVAADYGVSMTRIHVICGGSIKRKGIEDIYV